MKKGNLPAPIFLLRLQMQFKNLDKEKEKGTKRK